MFIIQKVYSRNKIDNKDRIVVGVNEYVNKNEEIDIPTLEISPEIEKKQKDKLASLKKNRNLKRVQNTLFLTIFSGFQTFF